MEWNTAQKVDQVKCTTGRSQRQLLDVLIPPFSSSQADAYRSNDPSNDIQINLAVYEGKRTQQESFFSYPFHKRAQEP